MEWNRGLLLSIFDIFWEINKAYVNFHTPNVSQQNRICYIVSDANPVVAGAYIAIGSATMEFENFQPEKTDVFDIPTVPKAYIEKYGLQSFFHSTRAEAIGLYKYIFRKRLILSKIAKSIDTFVILGDNLALITNLQNRRAANGPASFDVQNIIDILDSFKTPFVFRWLRRSKPPIVLADQLGRVKAFRPNMHGQMSIEKFFEIKMFIPKIFEDIYCIPSHLPAKILNPLRNGPMVPAIFFPLSVTTDVFNLICECFSNMKLRVLVGVPYFNRRLIHKKLSIMKALTFKNINTDFFEGNCVTKKSRKNMPFIVAFIKV